MSFVCYGGKRTKFPPLCQTEAGAIIKKAMFSVIIKTGIGGDYGLHLSEITITSPGNDTKGQQIQAVIAQNLYRLWFSCKNMMGITWWNIVDDCGAPGEPSVSGLQGG